MPVIGIAGAPTASTAIGGGYVRTTGSMARLKALFRGIFNQRPQIRDWRRWVWRDARDPVADLRSRLSKAPAAPVQASASVSQKTPLSIEEIETQLSSLQADVSNFRETRGKDFEAERLALAKRIDQTLIDIEALSRTDELGTSTFTRLANARDALVTLAVTCHFPTFEIQHKDEVLKGLLPLKAWVQKRRTIGGRSEILKSLADFLEEVSNPDLPTRDLAFEPRFQEMISDLEFEANKSDPSEATEYRRFAELLRDVKSRLLLHASFYNLTETLQNLLDPERASSKCREQLKQARSEAGQVEKRIENVRVRLAMWAEYDLVIRREKNAPNLRCSDFLRACAKAIPHLEENGLDASVGKQADALGALAILADMISDPSLPTPPSLLGYSKRLDECLRDIRRAGARADAYIRRLKSRNTEKLGEDELSELRAKADAAVRARHKLVSLNRDLARQAKSSGGWAVRLRRKSRRSRDAFLFGEGAGAAMKIRKDRKLANALQEEARRKCIDEDLTKPNDILFGSIALLEEKTAKLEMELFSCERPAEVQACPSNKAIFEKRRHGLTAKARARAAFSRKKPSGAGISMNFYRKKRAAGPADCRDAAMQEFEDSLVLDPWLSDEKLHAMGYRPASAEPGEGRMAAVVDWWSDRGITSAGEVSKAHSRRVRLRKKLATKGRIGATAGITARALKSSAHLAAENLYLELLTDYRETDEKEVARLIKEQAKAVFAEQLAEKDRSGPGNSEAEVPHEDRWAVLGANRARLSEAEKLARDAALARLELDRKHQERIVVLIGRKYGITIRSKDLSTGAAWSLRRMVELHLKSAADGIREADAEILRLTRELSTIGEDAARRTNEEKKAEAESSKLKFEKLYKERSIEFCNSATRVTDTQKGGVYTTFVQAISKVDPPDPTVIEDFLRLTDAVIGRKHSEASSIKMIKQQFESAAEEYESLMRARETLEPAAVAHVKKLTRLAILKNFAGNEQTKVSGTRELRHYDPMKDKAKIEKDLESWGVDLEAFRPEIAETMAARVDLSAIQAWRKELVPHEIFPRKTPERPAEDSAPPLLAPAADANEAVKAPGGASAARESEAMKLFLDGMKTFVARFNKGDALSISSSQGITGDTGYLQLDPSQISYIEANLSRKAVSGLSISSSKENAILVEISFGTEWQGKVRGGGIFRFGFGRFDLSGGLGASYSRMKGMTFRFPCDTPKDLEASRQDVSKLVEHIFTAEDLNFVQHKPSQIFLVDETEKEASFDLSARLYAKFAAPGNIDIPGFSQSSPGVGIGATLAAGIRGSKNKIILRNKDETITTVERMLAGSIGAEAGARSFGLNPYDDLEAVAERGAGGPVLVNGVYPAGDASYHEYDLFGIGIGLSANVIHKSRVYQNETYGTANRIQKILQTTAGGGALDKLRKRFLPREIYFEDDAKWREFKALEDSLVSDDSIEVYFNLKDDKLELVNELSLHAERATKDGEEGRASELRKRIKRIVGDDRNYRVDRIVTAANSVQKEQTKSFGTRHLEVEEEEQASTVFRKVIVNF